MGCGLFTAVEREETVCQASDLAGGCGRPPIRILENMDIESTFHISSVAGSPTRPSIHPPDSAVHLKSVGFFRQIL